jgi:hypothetical protein
MKEELFIFNYRPKSKDVIIVKQPVELIVTLKIEE